MIEQGQGATAVVFTLGGGARPTRTIGIILRSGFGAVFDLFGEFFDLLRFLYETYGEGCVRIGVVEFFFHFVDQVLKFLHFVAKFGEILRIDCALVTDGGLGVTDAVRGIRIGRVWRWMELAEGDRRGLESSGCCCESLNEVATGVDHGKHLRMIAREL
jgi:hypothetical protein